MFYLLYHIKPHATYEAGELPKRIFARLLPLLPHRKTVEAVCRQNQPTEYRKKYKCWQRKQTNTSSFRKTKNKFTSTRVSRK